MSAVEQLAFLLFPLEVFKDRFDNKVIDGAVDLFPKRDQTFDGTMLSLVLGDIDGDLIQ